MKKRVCFILLLVILTTLFCGCAVEKFTFTENNLIEYMMEIKPHLTALDMSKDQCDVLSYGPYSARISGGKVIELFAADSDPALQNLDDPGCREIAETIFKDCTDILKAAQVCIEEWHYTDLCNYPYSAEPYTIFMNISPEGMELFPSDMEISSIRLRISNRQVQQNDPEAVRVQRQYLEPAEFIISVHCKDDTEIDVSFRVL